VPNPGRGRKIRVSLPCPHSPNDLLAGFEVGAQLHARGGALKFVLVSTYWELNAVTASLSLCLVDTDTDAQIKPIAAAGGKLS